MIRTTANPGGRAGLRTVHRDRCNSAPTNITLSNSSIAENAGVNATVGGLSTTDPDVGNTFTYTLVSGTGSTGNGAFNISGSTLRATSSLDFEAQSSYSVRIRTTDQGGLFFEKVFTVNVTNVNEAPTGTDKTITINEDASHTFAASDFGFSDPNDTPANTLSAIRITTLPAAGTLKLSSVNVTAGQEIATASIPNLVYAPAGDANGIGYASFTFQVRDNGGTANGGVDLDQSANSITFNVTAINDAPSFVKGGDQTVAEDAGMQVVTLWATSDQRRADERIGPDGHVRHHRQYECQPLLRAARCLLDGHAELHPGRQRLRHRDDHPEREG